MNNMNNLNSELGKVLEISAERFLQNHKDETYLAVNEEEFEKSIKFLAEKGMFLIDLFAVEDWKGKGITLCYVFEKKGSADYFILQKKINNSANSIAREFPAACWYEREIADGFGITFAGAFDNRRLFLHESYPLDFHPLRKSIANEPIKMRKKIPNVQFSTDIIVGFPGETNFQFEHTVNLCKKVGFLKAYISMYSDRPMTAAHKTMEDNVPYGEKKRRWEILDELINKINLRKGIYPLYE